MPRAAASKFSQNGSVSTIPPSTTSVVHTTPYARRPADVGSRIHTTTAATSRPATTGYDHELIAYITPTESPAASASATERQATSPRGPAIATCSANASASTVNGIASTWAWRSPSVNENDGISLIVSLITRETPNQS